MQNKPKISFTDDSEFLRGFSDNIINSTNDVIIGKDLNGIILSWNPASEAMFGYTKEEAIGQSIDLIIPDDLIREEDLIREKISQGQRIEHFQTRRQRKNQEIFPVSVSISPIRNSTGEIIGASKILRDLTHIKLEEQRRNENQFRVLFNTIIDSVVMIDAQGRIQTINPAAVNMFGYSIDELQGKNVNHLMPEPYASEHDHYLHHYLTTGDRKIIGIGREVVGKRKDGSTFPMELAVSEMEVSGERMFTGIVRDITERKRAEAELRARENRIRALVDTIVDGIVVIDAKGNIQTLNPAAVRLFGYNQDEARGKNVKLLMPESYAKDHDTFIQRYLDTGAKKIIGIGREVVGQRKDGSTFPMELAISEMDVNGERMFTGIVRDITQRKAYDAALHAAKEQAIAANKAKSEFLSCMSHELRTPLNAILGYTQLFLIDSRLPPEQLETANEIYQAGEHLLTLISDLIDLSRIETGKIGITIQSTSLVDVFTDALNLVVPLARHQGITLINEVNVGDAVCVMADAVRLQQVVINLLSNAVKYNRPGGRVTLSYEIYDRFARIIVTDTGHGIPADKQSRVFTSFDRLGREIGSIEGTGIGLVLSKRIVEAMEGSIDFESTAGVGSSFWVDLPLADSSISKASSPDFSDSQFAAMQQQAQDSEAKLQILHIEDNPMNLRLMRQIFSRRDEINIIDAQTAELGLELAQANPPDIVIMDINLPGMSGIEALKHFKADPKTQEIPVIAVSATALKDESEVVNGVGFEAFLSKPIDVLELLVLVEKLTKKLTTSRC